MDELIINAIFDAPVTPDGKPLLATLDRDADFELQEKEHVDVILAATTDYMGACIVDQFGSLRKSTLLDTLAKYHEGKQRASASNPSEKGLGIAGALQAGMSLLYAAHPKVQTQVMLFFEKAETYKDFRMSFRFFSMLGM
jgi:hypothetical protein